MYFVVLSCTQHYSRKNGICKHTSSLSIAYCYIPWRTWLVSNTVKSPHIYASFDAQKKPNLANLPFQNSAFGERYEASLVLLHVIYSRSSHKSFTDWNLIPHSGCASKKFQINPQWWIPDFPCSGVFFGNILLRNRAPYLISAWQVVRVTLINMRKILSDRHVCCFWLDRVVKSEIAFPNRRWIFGSLS